MHDPRFRTLGWTAGALVAISAFGSAAHAQDLEATWPSWRGPLETGEAPGADPPIEFSTTKNLRWSVAIPGAGHGTPILVGELLVMGSAVPQAGAAEEEAAPEAEPDPPEEPRGRRGRGGRGGPGGRGGGGAALVTQDFHVVAVDRRTGAIAWDTKVHSAKPHEAIHRTASFASSSPVSDGKRILCSFGSYGVFALDVAGKPLWSRQLGPMQIRGQFGEGASPALHDGVLIVPHDHEGESFLVALDAETGEEKWRVARDEPSNWTTPLVRPVGKGVQVIVPGSTKSVGYDFATGKEVWHTTGMTSNVIPAPLYADGVVYLVSGFRGAALQALRLADAKGDATASDAMLWTFDRGTPYVPSPVLSGGKLYFFAGTGGRLSCLDAKTGEAHFTQTPIEELGTVYASPLAAGGRLYCPSREGVVVVLAEGTEPKVLAINEIGDPFDASPVAIGNDLYLRGHAKLYCFAKSAE